MKTIVINRGMLDRMISEGRDFLLLFTAEWCGYCAALKREIDAATAPLDLFEFDISNEDCPEWEDYAIQVVPTAIYFKGGREKSRKAASFSGLRVRDIGALSSSP